MKIISTKIAGVKIIETSPFVDPRGFFARLFCKNDLEEIIGEKKIEQINISLTSKVGAIRGMHFQLKKQQDKLITVIKGKIIDYSIDLRKNSKTFGKIFKKELSDKNCISLFIPKGFAHGFYTKAKENIVLYKNSEYREPKYEMGISILDNKLNLKLPKKNFILSKKDKKNITLEEFVRKYKSL